MFGLQASYLFPSLAFAVAKTTKAAMFAVALVVALALAFVVTEAAFALAFVVTEAAFALAFLVAAMVAFAFAIATKDLFYS